MKGNIKFFNKQKGFGFIVGEDMKEYFFSTKDVLNFERLRINDPVELTPSVNKKGLKAEKVIKL